MTEKSAARGRLAPSPTGFMHLGNAWAFLCAWLGARSSGGELIFRLEDVDTTRCRAEYAAALEEDLLWLGLDWDYGPGKPGPGALAGPFLQSLRLNRYARAVRLLAGRGLLYPCFCSRRELRELAGAPHPENNYGVYPGQCRSLSGEEAAARVERGESHALRLRFEESRAVWLDVDDLCLGMCRLTPDEAGGDFALLRSDGIYAYQLAVALDDLDMGVTEVTRGRDILLSTPGQSFLHSLFGGIPPRCAHVPLLLDHNGARLAKRHNSLTLRALRSSGVQPENIVGFLAWWSGLREDFQPLSPGELLPGFSFRRIKAEPALLPEYMERLLLRPGRSVVP